MEVLEPIENIRWSTQYLSPVAKDTLKHQGRYITSIIMQPLENRKGFYGPYCPNCHLSKNETSGYTQFQYTCIETISAHL